MPPRPFGPQYVLTLSCADGPGLVHAVAGFLVGLVEAYGQAYAATYAQILIFVLMAVVVLVRPAGLFGREEAA